MADVTLAHVGQFFKLLRPGRKTRIILSPAASMAGSKALFLILE